MNLFSRRKFTTREITVIGLLFAITVVLGVTGIGFIPIPPFKTTIMHIPVIIGGILEGPVVGAMTGLLFGLFSMLEAVKTPSPISFIFMNPVIAILPRMLIGVTSYYAYRLMKTKAKAANIAVGAAVGSFTNTLGVVGLIYAIYINAYAQAMNISYNAAAASLLVLVFNGFISAAAAIIFTVPVVMAVNRIKH